MQPVKKIEQEGNGAGGQAIDQDQHAVVVARETLSAHNKSGWREDTSVRCWEWRDIARKTAAVICMRARQSSRIKKKGWRGRQNMITGVASSNSAAHSGRRESGLVFRAMAATSAFSRFNPHNLKDLRLNSAQKEKPLEPGPALIGSAFRPGACNGIRPRRT